MEKVISLVDSDKLESVNSLKTDITSVSNLKTITISKIDNTNSTYLSELSNILLKVPILFIVGILFLISFVDV